MAARHPFKNHMTRPNAVHEKDIVDDISDDEDEDNISYEMFNDYMPKKLNLGKKHPDPVVQSASLANVEPPDIFYELSLPEETIEKGAISALQLEAIVYASQQHERILPNGSRAGFLIGDGAGVGKGRTVAGLIFENHLKGRTKSVWISVSSDLKFDTERDLKDIGAKDIKVMELSKCKYVKIDLESGVIFSTYQTLIAETKTKAIYKTRLEQLVDWCGKDFDGPIIFDECHRAKNLCPVSSLAPPKTGLVVLQLQKRLPKARVVYASATGASEPRHMAYMDRLGLWGEGSLYPQFSDFFNVVDKRGVGAMELVAMEMKLRGMYIARQLSFQGVSFKTEEVPLEKDSMEIYNDSVKWWASARQKFQEAADLIYTETSAKNAMWQTFWGAHQRFFKYLCIAAKVPHTVKITKQAIEEGKCVVIGLQSTGDAGISEELEKGNGQLSDFVSITKGLLRSLTEKKFPSLDAGSVDDINALFENMNINNQENIPVKMSREERVKRAKVLKKELLDQLKTFEDRLPQNTLDRLVDELGGPENVAEMTGRKGQVIRTNSGGVEYSSRFLKKSSETISINEKNKFMDGEKLIAIISEAASTGISLQSARTAKNQRRRVHITLELPWSADRAIQQFGRTHRSAQVNAPEYCFLISDLAGERRFVATVAKRLESLGALTHGDRRTTDARDFSKFNYSNKYGRRALEATMSAIMGSVRPLLPAPKDYNGEFFKDVSKALVGVGIILIKRNRSMLENDLNIDKFLNRILGLPINLQNKLFEYFTDTMDAVVTKAKKSGEFDSGILNLGSGDECAKRVELFTYSIKNTTGLVNVQLHVVQVNDRGLSWEDALDKFSTISSPKEGFYLSNRMRNNRRAVILVIAFDKEPTGKNKVNEDPIKDELYVIYRPHIGLQVKKETWTKIKDKYRKVAPETAKLNWNSQYVASERTCVHAYWKTKCMQILLGFDCEVGVRKRTFYILTGSVLSAWHRVEEILLKSRMNAKMQIVRLKISEEEQVIGTLVPKRCYNLLSKALTADAEKTAVYRERRQNLELVLSKSKE